MTDAEAFAVDVVALAKRHGVKFVDVDFFYTSSVDPKKATWSAGRHDEPTKIHVQETVRSHVSENAQTLKEPNQT